MIQGGGVFRVIQENFKDAKRMSLVIQRCIKTVSMKFQNCFQEIVGVFLVRFKDVRRMFHRCLKLQECIAKVLPGNFACVSTKC